jgi:hypothetical protein
MPGLANSRSSINHKFLVRCRALILPSKINRRTRACDIRKRCAACAVVISTQKRIRERNSLSSHRLFGKFDFRSSRGIQPNPISTLKRFAIGYAMTWIRIASLQAVVMKLFAERTFEPHDEATRFAGHMAKGFDPEHRQSFDRHPGEGIDRILDEVFN